MLHCVRETSTINARKRWLREYQRARNARKSVLDAFWHMPLHFRHDSGLHYVQCGRVNCRPLHHGLSAQIILERPELRTLIIKSWRDEIAHRHMMRNVYNSLIEVP